MTETLTHDDVINQEIEQEHQETRTECRHETLKPETEEIFKEKLNSKDYFPMQIDFHLSAMCFVDMKEFNSKAYYPDEVDAKRKEYIDSKLSGKLNQTANELKDYLEGNDYIPQDIATTAGCYNKDFTAFKHKIMKDLFEHL